MTRNQIESLKRIVTHHEREAKRYVLMKRPKEACKHQRWARVVSEAVGMAKDITFMKGKNDELD